MRERVLSQRRELERLRKGRYIRREAEERLRRGMKTDLVKVITGPRRAGKSFMAVRAIGERFGYANFDDEVLAGISDFDELLKLLHEVYGDFRVLFLDEVQNLEKWELVVSRLQRLGYNVVVTGSNSKLLSSELATHLTGRYFKVRLFPFSFKEFLKAKGVRKEPELPMDEGKVLSLLREYMNLGGFPEVVVKGYDPTDYGRMLFDSIILRDIVKRRNVRYSSALYDIAAYLTSNFGREFTLTKLKNIFDVGSVHTLKNYLSYLEEAYLILTARRFSYKLKETLRSPRKAYVIDPLFIEPFRTGSPDFGRRMENVVAVELARRGYELYYWKEGGEVDFVVKEGGRISCLIQVTKELNEGNYKREVGNLLEAGERLGVKKLLLITWDTADEIKEAGRRVEVVPLWKWLIGGEVCS